MKRNPWPYAIVAYFAIFITGVASWITFAMHHDQELVRPDYYEHEIRFQEHLEKAARANAIRSEVSITQQDGKLLLQLPVNSDARGELYLYRPSSSRLDMKFALKTGASGRQEIDTSALEGGYWRAHLSWNANGADFYFDQPLVLAGK